MKNRDLTQKGAASIAAQDAGGGGAREVFVPGEYGETLNIMFTTSTDLNQFMPEGLRCVDPHRGFIKGQRKKGGTPSGQPGVPHAPGLQIGITTMATTEKFGPRHRNILMWQSHPYGIGSTLVAVKRWGDAEMTYIFEEDRKLIAQGSPVPIHLNVQQYGYPLLNFHGVLDGKKRVEDPGYAGMYIGGEPGADLLSLTFDNSQFTRPLFGTGELSFGAIPIEREAANPSKGWPSTLLKDVKVEGVIYWDLSFTRSYGTEFETVRKAIPAPSLAR